MTAGMTGLVQNGGLLLRFLGAALPGQFAARRTHFLIDNTSTQLPLRFLTASMTVLPRVAAAFTSRGFGMIDSAVHRAADDDSD